MLRTLPASVAEDHLRQALDILPELLWTSLPDGSIDFLNKRWCAYTGLTEEQARGWGWQAAICPDDLAGLLRTWNSLLTTGAAGEAVARLRRYDGALRWFLFRAEPLRDAEGSVVKWYGQTTDIEDQKRAEAQLASEKQLLEMVARGRPLPVVLDHLCLHVENNLPNSRCAILLVDTSGTRLQHGAAPHLSAEYLQTLDGSKLAANADACGAAAALGTPIFVEFATDVRWVESNWRPTAIQGGSKVVWCLPILSLEERVLGVLAIHASELFVVTEQLRRLVEQVMHIASIAIERQRAEDAFRRGASSLAQAQRLSHTGSFSYRVIDGRLTVSDETLRICGFSPDWVPNPHTMRDLIHPEDLYRFREVLRAVDDDEQCFDCRLLLADGTIKYLQVAGTAVRNEQGHLAEWVGMCRDVTHQRLAEDALHQARADLAHVARLTTLGAVTASIAHEVNQPLAGIVTNASTCVRLLADSPPNLDGARETARRMIRDANRAAGVVARLKDLFRKRDAACDAVDLNEIVEEVTGLVKREIQHCRALLRVHMQPELPFVLGDRVQLQQVIVNLIVNATAAMNHVEITNRTLVVQTESQSDQVVVAVTDSGIGFDPSHAERLFEAFYTSKPDGMGMGLWVSRSIVDQHQGRLWATQNETSGATFWLSLPRADTTSVETTRLREGAL